MKFWRISLAVLCVFCIMALLLASAFYFGWREGKDYAIFHAEPRTVNERGDVGIVLDGELYIYN